MADKNKKNNGDQQKEGTERNRRDDDDNTVILKADLHCEGCVSKVMKCIRSFGGVENVTIGDGDGQRITVVGKVDAAKLRQRLEKKTHKKVEIISPAPSKKDENKDQKQEKKKEVEKAKNKEKELPVTTAVMKMQLHCQGCTHKIIKLVTKSKGYKDVKIDNENELVTVTGAMDMNALANLLKKHLKKEVHILPPKKEVVERKDNGGKGKGGSDCCGKAKGGGDGKGKGGGDGGGDKKKAAATAAGDGGDGDEKVVEGNKSQSKVGAHPVGNGSMSCAVEQFQYNPSTLGSYHAPQLFSDENPNACSLM